MSRNDVLTATSSGHAFTTVHVYVQDGTGPGFALEVTHTLASSYSDPALVRQVGGTTYVCRQNGVQLIPVHAPDEQVHVPLGHVRLTSVRSFAVMVDRSDKLARGVPDGNGLLIALAVTLPHAGHAGDVGMPRLGGSDVIVVDHSGTVLWSLEQGPFPLSSDSSYRTALGYAPPDPHDPPYAAEHNWMHLSFPDHNGERGLLTPMHGPQGPSTPSVRRRNHLTLAPRTCHYTIPLPDCT